MMTMTMTMLIREFSDLHQEFGPYIVEPMPEDKDTILILAGDIHVGTTATEFVRQMADSFAHVIYILGNHEFYQNEMVSLPDRIREELEDIENVSFLDDETTIVGDIRFIGSTLWSDMDNRNPLSMMTIERSLNDYGLILKAGYPLRAPDTIALFDEAVKFLETELGKEHDGPTVVVTHHGPSFKSVHPIFRNSNINGAFCSNLEHLLHNFDIAYWFHGHTHQTVHYEINGTKVRNNPFGYGHAENLNFNPTFRVAV